MDQLNEEFIMIDCKIAIGIVESRHDPLALGRCRVRVVGQHTSNKKELPTEMLPWAYTLLPSNAAGISGIGSSPNGVVEGTSVLVTWFDEFQQIPLIMGVLGGATQTLTVRMHAEERNEVLFVDQDGVLSSSSGDLEPVEHIINTKAMDLINNTYVPNINDATKALPTETSKGIYQLHRVTKPDTSKELLIRHKATGEVVARGYMDQLNKYAYFKLESPSQWKQTRFKNDFLYDGKVPGTKYRRFRVKPYAKQPTTNNSLFPNLVTLTDTGAPILQSDMVQNLINNDNTGIIAQNDTLDNHVLSYFESKFLLENKIYGY
jgi:hypothetical protein